MGEDYVIKLKDNYVPSKVENPTDWCAGMVVVPKGDKSVRICVDLKPLNNNVLREPVLQKTGRGP